MAVRAQVPRVGMQPFAIVENLNLVYDVALDVRGRRVPLICQTFGLESPEELLGQSAVQAVAC